MMMNLRWRGRRHMPEDVLLNILHRLPVKSVVRFRCVSKLWRALIDEHRFARSHLTIFSNNCRESHLLLTEGGRGWPIRYAVRCAETLKSNLQLPQKHLPKPEEWSIICSGDGLVLLLRNQWRFGPSMELMLWNPSIGKTRNLPPSPGSSNSMIKSLDFGMGYDHLTMDYKIVRLILTPTFGLRSVAIYSIKSDSWTTIEFEGDSSFRRYFNFPYDKPTFSLRGQLFGFANVGSFGELKLVSSDLSCGILSAINLPVVDEMHLSLTKVDGGNSVGLIHSPHANQPGGIWVLEVLGKGEGMKSCRWSKRYTFPGSRYDPSSDFFYLRKSGGILRKFKNRVSSYDVQTEEEEIVQRKRIVYENPCPYMESMILFK